MRTTLVLLLLVTPALAASQPAVGSLAEGLPQVRSLPSIPGNPCPSGVPRGPIVVVSDLDLRLPTSGVLSGSGTAHDPYLIAGWCILGSAGPVGTSVGPVGSGISLSNTQAHVVIADNAVAAPHGWGIRLDHARNVRVLGNHLTGEGGLGADRPEHLTIVGNRVEGSNIGIALTRAKDARIEDNRVTTERGSGIGLAASGTHVFIERNHVSSPWGNALDAGTGDHFRIRDNVFDNSYEAADLDRISNLTFRNNVAASNVYGFTFQHPRDFDIRDNVVQDTVVGITLAFHRDRADGVFAGNRVDGSRGPLRVAEWPKPFNVTWFDNTVEGLQALLFKDLRSVRIDGEGSRAAFLLVVDCEDVEVTNWAIDFPSGPAIHIVGGRNVRLHHNEVTGGTLFLAHGRDHVVEDNRFVELRSMGTSLGILLQSSNATIRHNVILNASIGMELSTRGAAPGREEGHPRGTQVVGNVIEQSLGAAIRIYGIPDVSIVGNRLRAENTAIGIVNSKGIVVRNNDVQGEACDICRQYWRPEDGLVDARWNWWGPGGPQPNLSAEHGLMLDPWLSEPPAFP